METATLYYVHDPMCSWCWSFRPTWARIVLALPPAVQPARLLGGLAPDTDQPMPQEMRAGLQATWRHIEQVVPGTEFNFDFWRTSRPRRATYPACRAVIAAHAQGARHEEEMIHAIQRAYYRQARNPSDDETLYALADEIGLDVALFTQALASRQTQANLEHQIHRARELDVDSYPSLVLVHGERHRPIPYDYRNPEVTLEALRRILEVAG